MEAEDPLFLHMANMEAEDNPLFGRLAKMLREQIKEQQKQSKTCFLLRLGFGWNV
jgi:hypothetical protein